ncbi:MAG: hypothetical protein EFT35_10000 [Methanophagales archaeon ANME-1-THS]|nr:MAG: hypothetical protein EFT35_10000 [Methanophagales archaeon ANME-1-THS]
MISMSEKNEKFGLLLAFGSVVLALALLCGGTSSATTIYVNTSGWWIDTAHFNASSTPIQSGITNAAAGDSIVVYAGSYIENIIVNKSVILEAEGPDIVRVTAADPSRHVFNLTANWVNISGFNITGASQWGKAGISVESADCCNISAIKASGNNYGIYLSSSSNNILQKNVLWNNSYGIQLASSSDYNLITTNIVELNPSGSISLSSSSNNRLEKNRAHSSTDRGISLYDSNNNTLTNNSAHQNSCGIYLSSSSNNTLHNNTATSNYCGIYLNWGNENNRLTNNTLMDNTNGIELRVSSNNTLENNTASNNSIRGIYLWASSNNNTLEHNNASSNGWFGIDLYDSSWNNRILNNTANFNKEYIGIYVHESDNTTLINNTAIYNNWEGIRLEYSDNCTVLNNNLSSNNFTDLGTGLLVWTSRNAIIRNNTVYDNDYGIYLLVGSNNNTIIDNRASYCEVHGIVVYQSSDAMVYHNTANHSGYHGIFVYDTPTRNITIWNNTACHNYYNGIFAAKDPASASGPSNLTIIGNILRDNGAGDDFGYGIYMGQGSDAIIADNYIADNAAPNHAYGMKIFSFTNATIHHNTIVKNNDYGILLDDLSGSGTSGSFGTTSTRGAATIQTKTRGDTISPPARLEEKDFYPDYYEGAPRSLSGAVGPSTPSTINVAENWIANNLGGISLNSSDSITIAGNTITGNSIGIHLTSSNDNLMYNNYFNNTNNADDDGMNKWNITKAEGINIIGGPNLGGNYWHDYTGTDADGDGLGDTPYDIPGGTNKDHLPLVKANLCGDVNCNGAVNMGDVGALHNHVQYGYAICDTWIGDVNCDEKVNMGDVGLLHNHVQYGHQICSDWAGDVNCDTKINMGDVGALHNHVQYGYALKCCPS